MESVEREQNQSVMSREQLIDLIGIRKRQFDEALTQCDSLKLEISLLEEKLYRYQEPIRNQKACLNPVAFAKKNCEQCGFFMRCAYDGKRDYGRFKL